MNEAQEVQAVLPAPNARRAARLAENKPSTGIVGAVGAIHLAEAPADTHLKTRQPVVPRRSGPHHGAGIHRVEHPRQRRARIREGSLLRGTLFGAEERAVDAQDAGNDRTAATP